MRESTGRADWAEHRGIRWISSHPREPIGYAVKFEIVHYIHISFRFEKILTENHIRYEIEFEQYFSKIFSIYHTSLTVSFFAAPSYA